MKRKARNVDASGKPLMKATCLMSVAAITAAVLVVKEKSYYGVVIFDYSGI